MSQRTNLISKQKVTGYILGSVFLWLLSGLGIIWIVGSKEENKERENIVEEKIAPTITAIPTEKIASESATTISEIEDKTASVSATPVMNKNKIFEDKVDGFRVTYENKRQVYQDTEESGNRYTFYHHSGNIAVHVGKKWSWLYPGRTFTTDLMVSGTNSSVYEISNQKIVDFEKNELKYTIQCVHNAKEELRKECEEFVKNFEFI